jgi:hypothetical protein
MTQHFQERRPLIFFPPALNDIVEKNSYLFQRCRDVNWHSANGMPGYVKGTADSISGIIRVVLDDMADDLTLSDRMSYVLYWADPKWQVWRIELSVRPPVRIRRAGYLVRSLGQSIGDNDTPLYITAEDGTQNGYILTG